MELTRQDPTSSQLDIIRNDQEFIAKLVEFTNVMKALPTEAEVKERYDGVTYIPIDVIEEKLDNFFNGLWETYDFKYQVIVNELVGDLVFRIYHPVAGVWLRRVGTGGVIIQQRAELDEEGVKKPVDVLDVSKKIPNTLEKDMGHLKAECIKNAAKSLGNTFGRNLLREITHSGINQSLTPLNEFISVINQMDDRDSLVTYFTELPITQRNDRRYINEIKRRELEIQAINIANQAGNEGPLFSE